MYRKLRGKIKEVYNTQGAFARAMGVSDTFVVQRLSGLVDWRASEIVKACDLLGIPLTDAHLYFFS